MKNNDLGRIGDADRAGGLRPVTNSWATPEELREGILRQVYGPPVCVHFEGFPPHEGERLNAYCARMTGMLLTPPPSRWDRFKALFR